MNEANPRSSGRAASVVATLVIGRSPFADVVIADPSVAPHHAELLILSDGRLFLTDCGAEGGTARRMRRPAGVGDDASAWEPIRQAFVAEDDVLRLGGVEAAAGELTARARRRPEAESGGGGGASNGGRGEGGVAARLRGRVERDPSTGEIVRRRP